MCERIWLQIDLANAASMKYLFTNDAIQFFWVHCKVLT